MSAVNDSFVTRIYRIYHPIMEHCNFPLDTDLAIQNAKWVILLDHIVFFKLFQNRFEVQHIARFSHKFTNYHEPNELFSVYLLSFYF